MSTTWRRSRPSWHVRRFRARRRWADADRRAARSVDGLSLGEPRDGAPSTSGVPGPGRHWVCDHAHGLAKRLRGAPRVAADCGGELPDRLTSVAVGPHRDPLPRLVTRRSRRSTEPGRPPRPANYPANESRSRPDSVVALVRPITNR